MKARSQRFPELIGVDYVCEALGCKRTKAYEVIKAYNQQLREQGFLTVRGKLPKKFFDSKLYWLNEERKESRFDNSFQDQIDSWNENLNLQENKGGLNN